MLASAASSALSRSPPAMLFPSFRACRPASSPADRRSCRSWQDARPTTDRAAPRARLPGDGRRPARHLWTHASPNTCSTPAGGPACRPTRPRPGPATDPEAGPHRSQRAPGPRGPPPARSRPAGRPPRRAPRSPTHRRPGRRGRPPAAAVRPITRSAAPCTSVRASSGAWSAIRVEAATVANDQPRPSRKSPAKICHELPSGERRTAPAPPAARRRRRPAPPGGPSGRRPGPTSGENANMPSTCTLITMPITASSAPPCSMCSGVITITATIAACAAARPSDGEGQDRALPGRRRRARPHDVPAGGAAATPAASRASSSGSGRSKTAIDQRGGQHAEAADRERPGQLRDAEQVGERRRRGR